MANGTTNVRRDHDPLLKKLNILEAAVSLVALVVAVIKSIRIVQLKRR